MRTYTTSTLFPTYTNDDFVVCTHDGNIEVWTMKDFKSNQIKLPPVTTDLRTVYWTKNASVLVPSIAGHKPACNRDMVLDGKNWRTNRDAEGGEFSLFWVVTRTDESGKHNMILEYVTLNIRIDAKVNGLENDIKILAEETPMLQLSLIHI